MGFDLSVNIHLSFVKTESGHCRERFTGLREHTMHRESVKNIRILLFRVEFFFHQGYNIFISGIILIKDSV